MTKTMTSLLFCAGIILSTGCSSATQADKDAVELEKISKVAADTCGSKDQVESVSLEGFSCKK